MTWLVPERKTFTSATVDIIPLDFEKHLLPLYEAGSISGNSGEDIFRFVLGTGPFDTIEKFSEYLKKRSQNREIFQFVLYSKRLGKIVGSFTLFDVDNTHGTCEIGSVWYSKEAQGTEINIETISMILSHLFDDLRYRRVSWRCNSKNQKSNSAAKRLGFTYEGTFRNHYFDKNESRDTSWYSIVDTEWNSVKENLREKRRHLDRPDTLFGT
jgi:RimJ/RimL family protein N-acetyltransferase